MRTPLRLNGIKAFSQLVERLEIVIRPRDADRRDRVAIAPRNVVFILDSPREWS